MCSKMVKQKVVMQVKSNYSEKVLILTKEDVKCFKQLGDSIKDDTWSNIFYNILEHLPHLKSLLNLENLSPNEVKRHSKFQHHVVIFGHFWRSIINAVIAKNCGELKATVVRVGEIGKFHAAQSQINFDAESWLYFKAALVKEFCGGDLISPITPLWISWNKVIMFVISEMKNAFLDLIREMNGKRNVADAMAPRKSYTPPASTRLSVVLNEDKRITAIRKQSRRSASINPLDVDYQTLSSMGIQVISDAIAI